MPLCHAHLVKIVPNASNTSSCSNTNLIKPLQRPQAQRETLRSTSDTDKSCDRPILPLLLYAKVGKSILACIILARWCTYMGKGCHVPNTLLAYRLADRN